MEPQGLCDPRFERVREAFARNFAEHAEVGAAVAIAVAGELVVDLWGGWQDSSRTTQWSRDTIVNVWSVGKAVTALCLLRLADRGLVELSAPVATYWPEFAQSGKAEVSMCTLMAHQAGLPAIGKPLPPGYNLTNWDGMCEALAEQTPWWEPGSAFGYHTNTFGFLLGEIVRRRDGRSINRYLQEELAQSLGVDFHFGFGPDLDSRVAEWLPYVRPPGEENDRPWLENDRATLTGVDLARVMAYRNPPAHPEGGVNTRLWRASEYPSPRGHANARAMATIFGGMATATGDWQGTHLLDPAIRDEAIKVHSDGEDVVLGRPNRFGLGFQLTNPGIRPLGPNPRTFGHYGNGAVLAFGDPDAEIGFGYVCNRAGRSWRDPRNIALIDALYASL
jgi:CubicO group peptidase (beta-lactamase class C family)